MIKIPAKGMLFVSVLALVPQVAQPASVYMVGGGDPAILNNQIYILLLTEGIALFNEDNEEQFVPGLGYEVTFVDGLDDDAAVGAEHDLVFIHETVNSADAARYLDKPVPILVTEDVLMRGSVDRDGGLWFTPEAGRGNAVGDFEFEIIDNTHPITSLFEPNELVIITDSPNATLTGIIPEFLAPAAVPLAKTGFVAEPERYSLAVADIGAEGFKGDDGAPVPPGADPAPERRVFLGFSPGTHAFDGTSMDLSQVALRPIGAVLFQRCVQWAAGFPVTADGTEEGVVPVLDWQVY